MIARIHDLEHRRDLEGLEAMRARATDPGARAELALALHWTNAADAKAVIGEACRDERLARDSFLRANACAKLRFYELAKGAPFDEVHATGPAPFSTFRPLFIAMISVNGNRPEPFIVDTGAPTTVISKRWADKVHLPYASDVAGMSQDAAGNVVHLSPTLIDSMKWGGVEIARVPAFVLELPPNFHVGGLLAPQDALRGTGFVIDGPAGALVVADHPDASMREAPLRWTGGNFFLDARVDDLPALPFLLDSGAGDIGVCTEAYHGHPPDGGTVASSSVAAGHQDVRVGLEALLAIGAAPPRKTAIFVAPCPSSLKESDPLGKMGYVGATWIWQRRVFFPADRRKLFFTEP